MKIAAYILVLSVISLSSAKAAVIYDFDVTYDGTSTTLDAGSDNPIGTELFGGDRFNYNVGAASNDFWKVDTGGNFFPFLAFLGSSSNNFNFDLSLLLGGAQQFSTSGSDLNQCCAHIGTNAVFLPTGLEFDEMILDYELIATLGSVTSSRIGDYFWRTPEEFLGISYIDNPASPAHVPEPSSIALLFLGLCGCFFARKRQFSGISLRNHR